jgi:hypothetical protein
MDALVSRRGGCRVRPGAVLGVSRGAFDHYAVFVRRGRVIHYTAAGSDISGDVQIRETHVVHFVRDAEFFWTMAFPAPADARRILERRFDEIIEPLTSRFSGVLGAFASAGLRAGRDLAIQAILGNYRVFTPAETLERARSRLGEHRYNLATQNCEHFALWCATGLATSQQVEGLLYGGAELVSALIAGTAKDELEKALDPAGNDVLGGQPLFSRSELVPTEALGIRQGRRSNLHILVGTGT